MIGSVTNADAIPVLERLLQIAGERHRAITNRIAARSTPRFSPSSRFVADFHRQLGKAIDDRLEAPGTAGGPLALRDADLIGLWPDRLLAEAPLGEFLLVNDGIDLDAERVREDLRESILAFRIAAELAQSRFDLINTAIRGRI